MNYRFEQIVWRAGIRVCFVVAFVWVLSLFCEFGIHAGRFGLTLYWGCLEATDFEDDPERTFAFYGSVHRAVARPLRHWLRGPSWGYQGGAYFNCPLWLPIVVVAGPTAWAFRAKRRAPTGCCSCAYDLTGNVSGVCPECG